MIEPPYRTVAVASTFSPRFLQVLAEAKRVRDRLCRQLHLIYVGARDELTAKKFAEALLALALPEDSAIHYQEGEDAAVAILEAANANGIDFLVAGGAGGGEGFPALFFENAPAPFPKPRCCFLLFFLNPKRAP